MAGLFEIAAVLWSWMMRVRYGQQLWFLLIDWINGELIWAADYGFWQRKGLGNQLVWWQGGN
jgi:hypothetical protein